jgi:hypothetical protein
MMRVIETAGASDGAQHAFGKDPDSSAPSDLAQAAERLMNVRRSVKRSTLMAK